MTIYIYPIKQQKMSYGNRDFILKPCVCYKQFQNEIHLFHLEGEPEIINGYCIDKALTIISIVDEQRERPTPEMVGKFDILNDYFYNEFILPRMVDKL